jgi:hypothetical protein
MDSLPYNNLLFGNSFLNLIHIIRCKQKKFAGDYGGKENLI